MSLTGLQAPVSLKRQTCGCLKCWKRLAARRGVKAHYPVSPQLGVSCISRAASFVLTRCSGRASFSSLGIVASSWRGKSATANIRRPFEAQSLMNQRRCRSQRNDRFHSVKIRWTWQRRRAR